MKLTDEIDGLALQVAADFLHEAGFDQASEILTELAQAHLKGRIVSVEGAGIEDMQGGGDGAYDLCGAVGSPAEIAIKVAGCLAETDLFGGGDGRMELDDRENPIFLHAGFRICKEDTPAAERCVECDEFPEECICDNE